MKMQNKLIQISNEIENSKMTAGNNEDAYTGEFGKGEDESVFKQNGKSY